MPISAWFMDTDESVDQRALHQQTPNVPVTKAQLEELGLLSWEGLDADRPDTDPVLTKIRTDRGYTYTDTITISPEKLPGYEGKLKMFFKEHLHTDEEIRYILEGQGYFDVRDKEDRWIRVAMSKGDLLVLPAGIYHRFTLDETNYLKAMRLFVGEPVWTPYNRNDEGTDDMVPRKSYIKDFIGAAPAAAASAGTAASAAATA